MWNASEQGTRRGDVGVDRDSLGAVGKVGGEKGECRTADTKDISESTYEDVVVNGIESGREVKKYESGDFLFTCCKEEVIVYE